MGRAGGKGGGEEAAASEVRGARGSHVCGRPRNGTATVQRFRSAIVRPAMRPAATMRQS